ncbi:hypothetical protein HZS_4400 [Henneguya salminicola]|nr:hypothetical protein HZS_4400 [Henneguya salminicola]
MINISISPNLNRKYRFITFMILDSILFLLFVEFILFVLIMKKMLEYGINMCEENYYFLNDSKILQFDCAIIFIYIGISLKSDVILLLSLLNLSTAICFADYMCTITEEYNPIEIFSKPALVIKMLIMQNKLTLGNHIFES